MKYFTFLALFLLGLSVLSAQVVDRYPYIQQPTETSVLVAWNTGASARGWCSVGFGRDAVASF